MARRHPSRVFVAIAKMAEDLESAPWPPHPDTNELPTVGVGSSENPKPKDDESGEFVDVLYRVEDEAAVEWTRVGPAGRDERFTIDVYVRSSILNQDRVEAWSRLEQLAEVVQGVWYNPDTFEFTPPAFEDVANLGGLTSVTPRMWATDEGYAGDCIVSFRLAAKI